MSHKNHSQAARCETLVTANCFHVLVIVFLLLLNAGRIFADVTPTITHAPTGLTVTLQGLGGNCLDVLNRNANPGAQVDNFTCNGTPAQVFALNYNGTITNFAGMCLDVLNGNATNGQLDFFNCNGTPAQQWQQRGAQITGLSGFCLDVQYGNGAPGTTVDLAQCNGTPAQDWYVINVPTRLQAAGTKCLDIIDSNTTPGAKLQIFECNGGPNAQIFTFTAANEIRNAAGECLDVMYGNAAGGQVQMWGCNGTGSQKWLRQGRTLRSSLSDGKSLFGNCLGAVNGYGPGSTAVESGLDHTPVGLVPCNANESQQWIAPELYVFGPATLLIVTSEALAPTFADFSVHKRLMGVPNKVLTMSQVRAAYPAPDAALSLKYAIDDYYRNFGTQYVLLGGDASHVPVRFRQVLDGGGATQTFVVSDLYYENLYTGHWPGAGFHGGFDNWDSNGNGLYDEQSWDSPLLNGDNVDGFPDVAVGRIPANNAASLSAALKKIVNYENLSSFPPANQFGWAADACFSGAYGYVQSLSKNVGGLSYAEEINPSQGCPAPASGFSADTSNWNMLQTAVQNGDFEWLTYIGHGGPGAWGYNGSWNSSQVSQLTNQYQPVVFSVACQTAQWENWILLAPLSYRPPVYDPNGGASSSTNIGTEWIVQPKGGAVAYIGENIVMEDDAGTAFVGYMFGQHANGFARLGDMWRMAQQQYFDANFYNPGYDNHFSAPRIYLGVVNLLGDPSMRTK
jgi:Peptidase family C25/Ricin-type beta-trefoil lectin domain